MPATSAELKPEPSAGQAARAAAILKQAIEARDPVLAASVYADDVEFVVVNRNYPPSKPLVRRGRAAVTDLYRDICSREMTHRISTLVVGSDNFAMAESCLYPDGCRVLGHLIAELRDGQVVRQVNLDCWDE